MQIVAAKSKLRPQDMLWHHRQPVVAILGIGNKAEVGILPDLPEAQPVGRRGLDLDFHAKTVVVTTGTFLRGLMHIGANKTEGGRLGDFSAKSLSASFLEAGIELQRLKTGTPPRILGRSIDFSKCEEQPGDASPTLFAFHDTRQPADLFHVEQAGERLPGWTPGSEQVSCWMTEATSANAHIIDARGVLVSHPVEHGVLPINFACPNLIVQRPDGSRTGISDWVSPWSLAVAQ